MFTGYCSLECGLLEVENLASKCNVRQIILFRHRAAAPIVDWNLRSLRDLMMADEINTGIQMSNDHSKGSSTRKGGVPLLIAIAIAIVGVLGMLIVDHGSWNKPQVQTAAMARHGTTGEAARAVGAIVVPTEPKSQLEPDAPGLNPVHPANPQTR